MQLRVSRSSSGVYAATERIRISLVTKSQVFTKRGAEGSGSLTAC